MSAFSIRYRLSSATGRVFDEWTEDYGAAVDFRKDLDAMTAYYDMVRNALGAPEADGSWVDPKTGLRLSWWIV